MMLRLDYLPLLILECCFLWIGEVWCGQPPLLPQASSTPSGHLAWPASAADSAKDDYVRTTTEMLPGNNSISLTSPDEIKNHPSTETTRPLIIMLDRTVPNDFPRFETTRHSLLEENSTTVVAEPQSVSISDSSTNPRKSEDQNAVKNDFSTRFVNNFVSSSGWRPIPHPKMIREQKQLQTTEYTTSLTSEIPVSTALPEPANSEAPFNGSPPLSESGWIPIPYPKPMRKGRTRVVYEHDYDDIITAPPPPRHGESFELVVGASLSGVSTHPRPTFNHSSQMRIKILEPPRSAIKKRNAGNDVSTTTKTTSVLSANPGYELLPEGNWTILEKTTFVQKFLSEDIPSEKLIIRQPVSIGRLEALYSGGPWPEFEINTPQPIVHLPGDRESSFSHSDEYNSRAPFITRITKPPAWTDTSAINRMFTVPKLEFRPSTLDDSLEKMLESFTMMAPLNEARRNSAEEDQPLIEDASPLQVAQKTLPGSVVINTARGPHNMFAYSAAETAEGFGRHPENAHSLNKDQKLDTKHFVGENDVPTKAEEKNKTILAVQPFMSTESLAYILIGACCGLSILCLLVVIVTMRCRRSLDEQKSFSTIHHHSGLINGWVADPYPKEPVLAYENNIIRSTNDIHTIQIDPWFNKTDYQHDLANIDFHGPSSSSIPTHGVRFETLGVGPCKQIKRTTVIPGHSTALLTDGHTAVMRELSSVSSSSSISSNSSLSSENYHPYEPMEEAPESLDIQEDLFDHTSSALHKIQNPALPKISEELPSIVVGLSDDPSLTDGTIGIDGPDSMIHWSTNDERLI